MKILVVDDEKTIVKGIKFNLENEGYQVDVCYDGETAVDMARRGEYAVILLDLMMPKLDGLGACQQIRQFSTVPIIMLTARSEDADKLIGFESGADDYITKPFNVKLLVSRCNNLVKSRRKLIEKFRNQQPATVTDIAVNQADRELIKKATEIISNNFENPEFNMNVLAAELGLGRNKLYTRMKEITGLTPNEFTLKMKLDESMRLLKNNPELNISEISDRLGFSTTQYFSKCFKSVFGMAPLTFRKSNPAAPDTSV